MNTTSSRGRRALWHFCAKLFIALTAALPAFGNAPASAQTTKWVATWTAAPVGAATLAADTFSYTRPHPALQFPFPNLDTDGATNQTIRMIVKPDLWGNTMRFRFSNVFGTKPVTLGPVRVGLQEFSGVVLEGTNTGVTFNGGRVNVTIPAGESIFSDAVTLAWVKSPNDILVAGRNLAVSFAVQGTSGPLTRHPVVFMTSYISEPGSGDRTGDDLDLAFPYTSVSSYFLDAVDVQAPADTNVIAVFGDSITAGTFSSLNTSDRWMNFLSRRLHEVYGDRVSVVNEAIGGNTVNGASSASSGQNAVTRLDRDILGISGLSTVIWLEGINDVGGGQRPVSTVLEGYQNVVGRLHAQGIRVVGATILSSFQPTQNFTGANGTGHAGINYGGPATFGKVLELNNYIRTSGLFDGFVDFYAATLNPATSALRPEFAVSSTDLSSIDYLHPNRAGFLAMANSINLTLVAPRPGFFNGERPLGALGVNYLAFPNGRVFGFYSQQFFPYVFHYDFGFVFFQDAGAGNAFLYDFTSQGWFYTGATLWPFLYDFNLGAWLRYEADPNRPGRYTSGPRRFFNFATNAVITK